MPRFSVVIPAYNSAALIGETIRSVLSQTEHDFELIVVDDGSTDETHATVAAIAAEDDRIKLTAQANQGTAAARNTGLALTTADYVSFLDNDDLWMPRYLESMGRALDTHPDASFAYCDAWRLDDATMRLLRRTELEARPGPPPGASFDDQFITLARTNFVMSSVTARREALEQVGGFAADIRGTDDYDLWFRLFLTGRGAVQASSTPLLVQRDRFDSQSKDGPMMGRGVRLVLERVLADERTPAAVKEVISGRLRAVDRHIAIVSRGSSLARAGYATRNAAIGFRHRLLGRRRWLTELPPDVAAAFPELDRRQRAAPRSG